MTAKSPRSAVRRAAAAALLMWIMTAASQTAQAVSIISDQSSVSMSATSGADIGTGSLNITSSGAQLAFSVVLSISTPSGVSWLSVDKRSATTPATLNLTANPLGLAVATSYNATLTIVASGATNSPLSIEVTFDVFGAKQLAVDTLRVNFKDVAAGSTPPPQLVGITSVGTQGGELIYIASATSGGNWLSVSPSTGLTPRVMNVSADTSNLAVGNTYQGTILINDTSNSASSLIIIGVTINVTAASPPPGNPKISFSPGALFFSTTPGTSPPPQNFQVANSGTGVLGWSAVATTTSGGNWLAVGPVSGTAPSTLTTTVISNALAQGNYNGKVTLTSSNATNTPQVVNTLLTVSNNAPIANQNGVVNGGSFSLDAIVAPNTIASLFGGRMSNDLFTAQTLPLPQVLGTTQVFVNGVAAPLFFVSNTQINFQMPPEVTGNTALVNVTFNGDTSAPITVNLAPAAPGIFTRNQQGTGAGAVLNADNTPNSPANPVPRGGTVVIFATGLGPTNPPVAAGLPGNSAEPFNRLITLPQVTIGGIDAHVDFAAVAPGFVGEYQVNAVVPPNVIPGSAVNVQITAGGKSSNIATIAVN